MQKDEDDTRSGSAMAKSYTAPDPQNVDSCRSIWYVGGETPQKAAKIMPGVREDEVRVQFLPSGKKDWVLVENIRRRNTWTDEPMEPVRSV